MNNPLVCRIASAAWEFEQIHRLNYKTFVEEIPQHPPNGERRLVDKFHAQNTYAICLADHQVVGMVAARGHRPFSLDSKLPDLDKHLPPGRKVCEIRLLSVEPDHRHSRVVRQLLATIAQHFITLGFDMTVISGTVRQQRLYRHLGFVPFGPLVGQGDALYQPMYLTLERLREAAPIILAPSHPPPRTALNFLPGPVEVHPDVRSAFQAAPVSHRSPRFVEDFRGVQSSLCERFRAEQATILLGSGTLANDAIAGQLSLTGARGLILSNGEFGERLVDHGRRFGLSFEVLAAGWGEAFRAEQIQRALTNSPGLGWLWAVHCETSTGVLNDLDVLKEACGARGIKLCLDCISSIGVAPVDLRGVWLASGASGKGLAAYPGLALLFHPLKLGPASKLPRYLDVGLYAANDGIPFTHSSNLLAALRTALQRFAAAPAAFEGLASMSSFLRSELRHRGLRIVAEDAAAAPAVITVALPEGCSSAALGQQLEDQGVTLSYRSQYLAHRNWIQICLMGECPREKATVLLQRLDLIQSRWR